MKNMQTLERQGNQVLIKSDFGTQNVLRFAFPEQAELYELVANGKIDKSSEGFAKSIANARNPSSNQMFWVKKLISAANGVPMPIQSQPTMLKVDFSKVMEMFQNAKQHLKRPKITLMLDETKGQKVRFSLDRFGSYMNMYGSEWGVNYGRIDVSTGQVYLKQDGRNNEQALMKLLNEFCAEPRKVAILHGKLTGNCCFCSLPLSDARSLQMGYGPYCADHWHLPWGEKPKFTPEGEWIGVKVGNDPVDVEQAMHDEPPPPDEV